MDSLFSTSPASVAESPLRYRLQASRGTKQHQERVAKDAQESISLADFVKQIPNAIEFGKRLVNEESVRYGSKDDPITRLFQSVNLSHGEWERYAFFDANRNYTRNLIATDDERYMLLLLCWNPSRESPIHDHPCDGCWMQVCRGQVQECRYEYRQSSSKAQTESRSLECIHDETYTEGQLAYIADSLGYHKVGNPNATAPAVTMHLYVPPIKSCKIWMSEDSGPSKSYCSNHSEYGSLLE